MPSIVRRWIVCLRPGRCAGQPRSPAVTADRSGFTAIRPNARGSSRSGSPVWSRNSSTACPRPLPVAVVVDDQHAAGRQPGVEVLELVPRRLVPVGVQPEDRDAVGRLIGDRLLDQSRVVVDPCLLGSRSRSFRPARRPGWPRPRAVVSRPCLASISDASLPSWRRSLSVGGGIPSNVSNRWSSRSVAPASSSVSAAACMLPPRHTPHSTIVAGHVVPDHVTDRLDQPEQLDRRGHRPSAHPVDGGLGRVVVVMAEVGRASAARPAADASSGRPAGRRGSGTRPARSRR